MASLLSVENLQVQFQTKKGINTAVDGVSFSVEKGRILGIVGESGCGKSVTSMSILQLLGSNARISGGSIKLDGKELIGLPEKEMCRIRGNDIAMIFQDPMTALNPTLTIGTQLMEPIMLHQNCGKKEAWTRAVDVLKRVGIAAPEKRMKEYPHQLSATRSLTVVINGPEATAGSTPTFLKNSGIQVPTALEISIARSRATPMQPDTAYANTKVFPLNK